MIGAVHFPRIWSGNPDNTIYQEITPNKTREYPVSIDCLTHGSNETVHVAIHDQTGWTATGSFKCSTGWETHSVFTPTLTAGQTYTVTIKQKYSDGDRGFLLDNITLGANPFTNSSHPNLSCATATWDFSSLSSLPTGFEVTQGTWGITTTTGHYANGALYADNSTINELTIPAHVIADQMGLDVGTDIYAGDQLFSAWYQSDHISNTFTAVYSYTDITLSDSVPVTTTWMLVSQTTGIVSPPGPLQALKLRVDSADALLVDDLHIVWCPDEENDDFVVPDEALNSASPECPFCAVQETVGQVGDPINTRNGNLSYQVTDLSLPVRGHHLAFRRSYASRTVDEYTGLLGAGWTHNYAMRLHLTGNTYSESIELQAPGGSQLIFFAIRDNNDQVIGYAPYPGVTAGLQATATGYKVTGFNQMTYLFDSVGRLTKQRDASGNAITFTYDGSGRLEEARQGDRYLTYAYNASSYLIEVTDHTSRSVMLDYDSNNDLVTVVSPLGLTSTYAYSGTDHLLTQMTDPSGRTIARTEYDTQGRAIKQWDGEDNLLVEIDFTIPNTHVVTENGIVTTQTYDYKGTLINVTIACAASAPGCGVDSTVQYDANFRASEATDANGESTQLTWNGNGSTLNQVTNALSQTTDLTYDNHNNVIGVEDARENTTQYFYDDPAHPTFRTRVVDASGQTTVYPNSL